jgi:hypothetical protein
MSTEPMLLVPPALIPSSGATLVNKQLLSTQ